MTERSVSLFSHSIASFDVYENFMYAESEILNTFKSHLSIYNYKGILQLYSRLVDSFISSESDMDKELTCTKVILGLINLKDLK